MVLEKIMQCGQNDYDEVEFVLKETIEPALKFAEKGGGVAFLPLLPSFPRSLLSTSLLPPLYPLPSSLPPLPPSPQQEGKNPCYHSACAQLVPRPGHNSVNQLISIREAKNGGNLSLRVGDTCL